MELLLQRKEFTTESTVGELYVNGVFECYVLEDVDRGLEQTMPLDSLQQLKVPANTCIPYGRYEVGITFSNKFQKYLPLLMSVPGYEGVRIHPGNTAADTEGCLLVGQTKALNAVGNSRVAFNALFSKLTDVEKTEKIFITIQK